MEKITIIICDDHSIFRQGLIRIIENEESFKIAGECGNGTNTLKLIKELQPDIAILDISVPGKSGLDIAQIISSEQRLKTKCIILTMHTDEEYFNEAMEIGIKGYLLKENAVDDLIACIKAVTFGKYYISPSLSDYLINYTKKNYFNEYQKSEINKLSCIERKVLSLVAENKTNKEIAQKLCLSVRTIQNHRQHIKDKLDIKEKMTLKQLAMENKIYLENIV